MTDLDPADRLASLLSNLRASPPRLSAEAPVSPRRDLGALPTPELSRPEADQRTVLGADAASLLAAREPARPTGPARPTTPAVTTGALVAWAHRERWQYGLVVSTRRRDATAFLVPIDAPRLTVLKPLDELVLIFAPDALHAAVQARHAEVAR